MSGMMNKTSYLRMIEENLEWLRKQPNCSERMHIECIVASSPQREYNDQDKIEVLRDALRNVIKLIGTQTDCQCQGEADCGWCRIRKIVAEELAKVNE